MICIDLEYRSWWCPWRRRVRGYAPSRWWEMDESHFISIVRAVHGQISGDEYFASMFGLPVRLVKYLDPWHRYVLESQLKWMASGESITSRFFVRRIAGLHAPEESLSGVSLQQFMTVDTFFVHYSETVSEENPEGDLERLCKMVASLYLRPNETYFIEKKGDRLVDIDDNSKLLYRRADRALLYGVFMNWIMIRNWLSKAYPLLFPKAEEGKAPPDKGHRKNGWLDTFDAFMGDDIAHLDTYRKMAATDAFRIMNKRIRENLSRKLTS